MSNRPTMHGDVMKLQKHVLWLAIAGFLQATYCSAAELPPKAECIGDKARSVKFESILACEKLAENPITNFADRAQIYFHLAVAQSAGNLVVSPADAAEGSITIRYLEKAIEADPEYVEPYIYATMGLMYTNKERALDFARRGLKANINSPRLGALNAYVSGNGMTRQDATDLCDKASSNAKGDFAVNFMCGKTYVLWKDFVRAGSSFEKATKAYVPRTRQVYGLLQLGNPWVELAKVYSALGQPLRAAETLDKFQKSATPFDLNGRDYIDLGNYWAEAHRYENAAEAYDMAAQSNSPEMIGQIRFKQMLFLAKAGKTVVVREKLKSLMAQPNLNFILRLQVFLKNSVSSQLKITGKMDSDTQAALDHCLDDYACSIYKKI